MHSKKTSRLIRDFFARLLLRGSIAAVFFIPLPFLRCLGIFLGKLFYCFLARYRELATSNLRIAFPDKEEGVRQMIMRNSFTFLGENGLDSLWFITRSLKRRRSFVFMVGEEFLDAALDKRRGVIAVTAHVGAFTILGGVLASYGYKAKYILRTPRDEKMSVILERGLRMQQVRPIFSQPAIRCVNESINVLRHNEILIILLDQDIGGSGIFINFFGRSASTPIGPVIFALRTGASILPMFMFRENDRHKLIIQPEFKIIYGESAENTVLENTQRLTKLVENVIKEYPEQWSWVDRRWKTQPRNHAELHAEPRHTGYA